MRTRLLTLLCVMGLAGCPIEVIEPDGGRSSSDGSKCPAPPDLTPLAAPCAAAKGLGGDILRCIDFSAIADGPITNPPPAQLTGWDFNNPPNCWEIANGKLQVRNFSSFASSCGFLMPAVSATDYNKYNRFTLSLVHRVDISEAASQTVQVLLGVDQPLTRLVTQWTGKQARQQSVLAISKPDLPNGGTNSYQPLFKITSGGMVGSINQGWQIESIALSGGQDP